MQTLRKKTSPCKYKNEPSRFLGEGVSFKAKLIGILEVNEARGDRMCQEALADLKMAIRAAGEHKQRITINIAIDGLRLRDEKTGDSLYHHPVHKISFIAQDMSDSRAFGYIFGSPDTGHRFFGIKTDKAASQVVIAMRDLFQVVFELKKKEIELAKQHIEQKNRFGTNKNTSSLFTDSTNLKNESEQSRSKLVSDTSSSSSRLHSDGAGSTRIGESAIADLVDLELELSSIQQGIHQMERITPSDPFGPNKDDPFNNDPFGDSFTTYPKPFLPPPPSAKDRPSRTLSDASNSILSPKTPKTGSSQEVDFFKNSQEDDWFSVQDGSLFDETTTSSTTMATTTTVAETAKVSENVTDNRVLSQFDVFTELDPLGTGRSKPYIDKKLFFQELKNPPKKVLKDLVSETQPIETTTTLFNAHFDTHTTTTTTMTTTTTTSTNMLFETDPFDKTDPFADDPFTEDDPFNTEQKLEKLQPLFPSSARREKSRLDSESECAPEPPPRPAANITPIKPPPLPPKKQTADLSVKPPPRPPHTDESSSSHYDYMDHYETGLSNADELETPPLPVPMRKARFESTAPQRPKKSQSQQLSEEDYLTPVKNIHPEGQIETGTETKPTSNALDVTLSQLTLSGLYELANKLNIPPEQLSVMTLVQLTSYLSNCGAIATLPTFKADFSANFDETQNKNDSKSESEPEPYDRYAVFRELLQQEQESKKEVTVEESEETKPKPESKVEQEEEEEKKKEDRYAALREIVIEDSISVPETKEDEEQLEETKQNDLNQESLKENEEQIVESNIIEYETSNEDKLKSSSPVQKSPELIQTSNNNVTSGSVSVSGSSPEIDNVAKKNVENTTRESWAIFDTPIHHHQRSEVLNEMKEKQQSGAEEGVSPWSSDSKEFGNGSPSDWRRRSRDSGSEGDWTRRKRDRGVRDSNWWDNQGQAPETYEKPSRSTYHRGERRSTDSYEEEWYKPDRPRRRTRQQQQSTWSGGNKSGGGGQSSSSRDVSPWEEDEPHATLPRREECWPCRRSRGPSWDRNRTRRDDSWDEDEDYEYEDEYIENKFRWPERNATRESRDPERHDHWGDSSGGDHQWISDERRHVSRRRGPHLPSDERWCRPDWDHDLCGTKEKIRYGGSRWPSQEGKWRSADRERKRDLERYYKRDHSQESPWEDDYSNDPDEPTHSPPRYLTASSTSTAPAGVGTTSSSSISKRNWKRPSSASEMDRKSGEIKSRPYYMGAGGSDGERDRKYRNQRRSKSRDSQFTVEMIRHKPETTSSLTLGRYTHRNRECDKLYISPQKFENDFSPDEATSGKSNRINKKLEPERKQQLMFQNDFVHSETDSPSIASATPQSSAIASKTKTKFHFENDFETSETESPVSNHYNRKNVAMVKTRHNSCKNVNRTKKPLEHLSKSMFEDDFFPIDEQKSNENEQQIKLTAINPEARKVMKHRLLKNRTTTNNNVVRSNDLKHLKKSESVNIFARENDPFDGDDFFSGQDSMQHVENTKNATSPSSSNNVGEFKWTEDFDTFNITEEK